MTALVYAPALILAALYAAYYAVLLGKAVSVALDGLRGRGNRAP